MMEVTPIAQPRNFSAIRRAIVIGGAALAVIILVGRVILTAAIREQTIEAADRTLATVSRSTSNQIAQTLSAVDIMMRSLQDVAMKPSLPDQNALRERASTAAFQQELVRWQKMLPQVDAASVVDVNGDILANTRQFPAPRINMRNADFFQELKNQPDSGVVIKGPIFVRLNEQWMLYLARALVDDQGRFAGIVLAGIRASFFEHYFSMVDVGPDTAAVLAYQTILIARWPHNDDAIGKVLPGASDKFVRPAAGETAVNLATGADQILRRIAVTNLKMDNNSLYVAVSQSESAILLPWRRELSWVAFFSALNVIIIGILIWCLFRVLKSEEDWRIAATERELQLSRQTKDLAAARDQAQTANRARGEFLANVSHELRTPLNAILGFSEILQKELFGPLGDSRYRDFVTYIHGSGLHLLEIVGNILDLTKIDVGRLELDEHEVDIVDIMQLCVRLVGDTAAAGGVDLEFQCPAGRPLLWADPTRLKQILFNLLANAIKFTPAGKRVVLSAGDADGGYFIMVSDAGIGMSPEDLEDAMQPFRQIDNSLAKRYQGTGLGLPLTKSLVELHGGVLEIQSEPGKGTTAIVTLPVRRVLNLREPNAALRASGRS